MEKTIDEQIFDVLKKIETGELTIEFVPWPEWNPLPKSPDDIYAGNVLYRISNGWGIVIFNDCSSFDYIDRIFEWGGDVIIYNYGDDAIIDEYEPSKEIQQNIYKIGLKPK